MARAARAPLARAVGRLGRSATYHRRGLWAIKAKNGGSFPAHDKAAAPEAPAPRAPRFYPADDVPAPKRRSLVRRPTKLRSSITPGTVLIVLAGHFKGKRVVFLKQLDSGLLLVTGPFNVNGVPLRRVNQAYVIGTSTKTDISGIDLSKYSDAYFKRPETKKQKGESEFFDTEKEEKKEVSEERKADQKEIDSALAAVVEKTENLKAYLSARFSLRSGQKPHELVF